MQSQVGLRKHHYKASGGDGISVELFQILKDDAMKVLHSMLLIYAGLDEAQTGIEIARRNISNLKYADDTTLMAESEEELKSLLMKVKEGSEKSWLKTEYSEN